MAVNWPCTRLKTGSLPFRPLHVQKLYFVNAKGSSICFFFSPFFLEENDQTLPRRVCTQSLRDMPVCWKNRGDLSTVSVPIWDVGLHSSGLQRALDPVHKTAAVDGATRVGRGKKGCTTCQKKHVYYHYDPQGKFQSVIIYTCIKYIIIYVSYAAIFIYKYQSDHNVPDSGGTLTFDLLEVNTTYYLV